MKKKSTLILKSPIGSRMIAMLGLFMLTFSIHAQTIFFTEDFENVPSANYTPSVPDDISDIAARDYFGQIVDGTLPAAVAYTNVQGLTYYGAQDTDGTPSGNIDDIDLNFNDIDISGQTGLQFCVFIAEDDDGSNQDWDGSSSVIFQYDIDNSGTFTNMIAVEAELGADGNETNEMPRLDTDFDGVGDGAEITDSFTQYCFDIPQTGSLIDLKVAITGLDSGDEDVALDQLTLAGTMTPPMPICFYTEDFEDETVDYSLSQPECNDTNGDYFTRTDGSNIGGTYNNPVGTSFFAAQDIDASPCMMPMSTMIYDDLSIANFTNIELCVYLAEDQASNGDEDWDPTDFLHINYDIDNSGSTTPAIWVEADPNTLTATGFNGLPRIDTDFDGEGDGAEITDDFTQYCFTLPATGSVMDIEITFAVNSGDEDIAIDELTLCGIFVAPTEPTISQTDEDGDGLSDITDPCSCDDPENLSSNGVVYFHDFVTIISDPGEAWTLTNLISGNLYAMDLTTTYGVNTVVPEIAPGVYQLVFWTESTVGFSAEFNRSLMPVTPALAASSTCDASLCCDLTGSIVSTVPSCLGDSDGTISFSGINCTTCADVEYSIDNITYQPSPSFTGLTSGTYQVFARDTENFQCTIGIVNFELEDPSSSAPIIICPPADITVECDDVPTAPTLSAVDLGNSGLEIWINEFHYDNTGGDIGEFVEVAGIGCTDLSGYNLELYNGSNGTIYNTTILGGEIPDEGDGFGAVSFPISGIQNGAPDGIALIQNGIVIQFLSYEGTFTATNGTASGMTSTDIGVFQPGSNPVMLSLQLMGTGTSYNDFTWSSPSAETPGAINAGQTIESNVTVAFNETTVAGGCEGESTISRVWTATDDCGNAMIHVQTITVEDNTAPQVACQNITIQLNENGEAEILPNEINDPNASTSTSVMVGNTVNQLPAELKANAGFCPTPAVSTNICDCPTGFVAVGYSGLTGNSYGNVVSQFSLHCKEVMANGDLGTTVTVTCSNGTLATGTNSGPLLATGNDVLVGAQLNIGCAIDGITGYSKPISEILSGDVNTNSSAITILGGMGGSPNPASYVPAGSVIIGMETFEDPSPPNGTSLIGVSGGVAWRYASLSEISGPTEDNCAPQGSLTYSLSQSLFTCADVGENLVTLSVTDPCGNTGTCTAIVTVEDNVAPVVTCPDNIYVHLDPGACDAIVTWNPATATDACGIASVVQTGGPVSGTTFDRNTTTTVSYEVTDVNGNTATCSFTIEIIEFVPASNDITCNTLVNITLDENCSATVGADQILEGNNYGCYDDYIVTFVDTGLPVILDGSHVGNTYEVMVVGPAGIPCWGNIFVEDKLIPDLVCSNDVTVRCDDDTNPGSPYVATSAMVAPTMSVDNATVSETVTFGANNGDVVDVDVTVDSDHTWVGDLVISITSPSGTTVELMNNIGGPGLGCAGNGLDLVFDDAATLTYADLDGTCNNDPAAEGTFQPLDALSVLNGEPASGDWTVSVTDLAGGDSGDINVTINLSANSTIPFPVPEGVTITPAGANTWTLDGFDPCGEATLTNVDVESGELCDGTAQIERTWTVVDESGNTTSCTEVISITPTTLADVVAELPGDITLECGDALPAPLTDIGCDNIGIALNGEPAIIEICEGSYKMLRKYILVDWCDNSTLEHLQIIKVLDTGAPTVDPIVDMTISTNSNDCTGSVQLPVVTATDACSSTTVSVTSISEGTLNAAGTIISDLPIGTHSVTYTATDGCGNEGTGSLTIIVEDQIAPIAICDEFTILGIGSDGNASIDAITFDDGSTDNCGIVSMLARRMDNPNCPGFDATPFGPSVPFTCCDVNTTVMVEFQVTDAAGNVNSCMVEVEVQDKIDPSIVCPANTDIDCTADYLSDIIVGQPLPQSAIDANGEALATDNCAGVVVTNSVISNSVECGAGTITIVWTATDAVNRTASCIQRYFVTNSDPFVEGDITWPLDYTANTCGTGLEPSDLSSPYNYPVLADANCSNIAVGHDDQVLDFGAADACLKILRKWYVIDWCQATANQDPTQPGPGVWHHTQIIKVINSTAPIISCEPDNGINTIPNFNENCEATFVELKAVGQDDCTPANLLEFTWALSDGQSGVGNDASQNLENGDYTITFTVTDLCGNTSDCTRSFSVVDAKKPTPVCIFGIATTVMPSTGSVTIWASDFESGSSYDNCTAYEDLQFSFSQDVTLDNITINCDDIPADGLVPVSIYVTDEAGNFDFCSTFINVQDPNGVCASPTVSISGVIENEVQELIEEVKVKMINVNGGYTYPLVVTGSNGEFSFTSVSTSAEYNVAPTKNINYLNGVTTYDLVLISKHILGTELLDSPYKIFAADANNSQSVTTLDIVKLRALILHIEDELADNSSWRFVDANHIFTSPINPWETTIPEDVDLAANGGYFNPANFVAVKIGDVNGSASPNSLLGSDTRTLDGSLAIQVKGTKVEAGETFTIDFRAKDFNNISGYQFTLGFDQDAIEFIDVITNLENLGTNNFGLTKLEEGVITTSWNNSKGITVDDDATLFSMEFVANNTIATNEVFKINSRYTASEAYANNDLYEVVLDFNVEGTLSKFELYQNTPNPFKAETTIGFNVPESGEVTLKIYDVSGRVLKLIELEAIKGFNSVKVNRTGIDATGVLYYQLETATETATKKMILVD